MFDSHLIDMASTPCGGRAVYYETVTQGRKINKPHERFLFVKN